MAISSAVDIVSGAVVICKCIWILIFLLCFVEEKEERLFTVMIFQKLIYGG
jgi:hypothetical protein